MDAGLSSSIQFSIILLQYLKYFGSVEAQRFAIIRVSGDVLHDPELARQVASSLAFLHRVGLTPVVVHGAGVFTGRRSEKMHAAISALNRDGDISHSKSDDELAQDALAAAEEYMLTTNTILVEELARAGVPAQAFPGGVFSCTPDPSRADGPLKQLAGRIE